MAVLNYISAISTTAPISADYSTPSVKVLLPKKKPMKWSTRVAPGEYGGPPITIKLRKYWGGEKEDPLTSDEFIWNNDFMGRMKKLIEDTDESSSVENFPVQEEYSGFLSLNRVMSLDRLEVDLSKELTIPSKAVLEEPVETAIQQATGSMSGKWRFVPTRREQEKWDKASKAVTGGSDVMFRELRQPRGDPAILSAQSSEQCFKLKKKLQILTLGIGGVGLVSAYVSYSPEIAGSTVDSMADGAQKLIKGVVGHPRLLVPVVLVTIYTQWNGIAVPEYGFTPLELIPMLVGFFTYKIATFIQAIEDALPVVEKKAEA